MRLAGKRRAPSCEVDFIPRRTAALRRRVAAGDETETRRRPCLRCVDGLERSGNILIGQGRQAPDALGTAFWQSCSPGRPDRFDGASATAHLMIAEIRVSACARVPAFPGTPAKGSPALRRRRLLKKVHPGAELAKIRAGLPVGHRDPRCGGKMKPASERISSQVPWARPGNHCPRAVKRYFCAPNGPISLVAICRRSRGKAPGWSSKAPVAFRRRWRRTHRGSAGPSIPAHALLKTSISSSVGTSTPKPSDPRQHHRPGAAATRSPRSVEPGGGMPGNSCATTGCRTGLANPTKTSSR